MIEVKPEWADPGSVADGRALAYGHSYTGNALGCAAARAGLAIFREENVLPILQPKIRQLDSQVLEVDAAEVEKIDERL